MGFAGFDSARIVDVDAAEEDCGDGVGSADGDAMLWSVGASEGMPLALLGRLRGLVEAEPTATCCSVFVFELMMEGFVVLCAAASRLMLEMD